MHAGRHSTHATEKGHFRGTGEPKGVLLSDIPGAQKRWQAETCDKSQKTQSISEDRALQNGRHPHFKRPTKSRRLHGQDRPEGCLFHDTHGSGG